MTAIDDKIADGNRTTDRLVAEIHTARKSWASFEGLNGKNEQHREPLRRAASSLQLSQTLHWIEVVLVRDTISTLFRVTDNPAADRLTLCRISQLLEDSSLVENRINMARNWIPNSPSELSDCDAKKCVAAMSFIKDRVSPSWHADNPPKDRCLFDLRTKLRPIRDRILSHSLPADGLTKAERNEVSKFLAMASEIVERVQLVFHGAAASGQSDFERRYKEASEFWQYLQDGLKIAVKAGSALGTTRP